MSQFIVTVKYTPTNRFDKGWEKFRVNAMDESHAKKEVTKHSLFPKNGIVTKVVSAAYNKRNA